MGASWSEQSRQAAVWFERPDSALCIEGVAVPRALRKWLRAHAQGKPVDELHILTRPYLPLSQAQVHMQKGIATVLEEIVPELHARGVRIVRYL